MPADETKLAEPSKDDGNASASATQSPFGTSRVTPRPPNFIKEADAAALEGNRLTSQGDYRPAQEKFLEAINLLMSGEDERFPNLHRRLAYTQQLTVALRAEIKKTRGDQNNGKAIPPSSSLSNSIAEAASRYPIPTPEFIKQAGRCGAPWQLTAL